MTIYEGLFDKPMVNIEDIMDKLSVSNASAGRLVDKLIDIGILANLDNRKRKRVFVYKGYMDIFNKD